MQSTLRLQSHAVRSCRLIAGRRYALASAAPYRSFHQSVSWQSKPSSDANGSSGANGNASNEVTPVDVHNHSSGQGLDPAAIKQSSPRRRSYIETIRSGVRDRKTPDERPAANPITLPRWYLDRNVTLYHEAHGAEKADSRLGIFSKPSTKDDSRAQSQATGGDDTDGSGQGQSWNRGHRYVLNPTVWENLRGLAKASFMLPPPEYANDPTTDNSLLVLQAPFEDGVTFLDTVVHKLARDLDANLVTLDAQDIVQLCTEQERLQGMAPSSIRSLSYEIYNERANEDWAEASGEGQEREDEGEETSGTFIAPIPNIRSLRPRILSTDGSLPDIRIPSWLKSLTGSPAGNTSKRSTLDIMSTRSILNKVLSSALRPQSADRGNHVSNTENAPELPSKVIVQIQDYMDLKSSRQGFKILDMLLEIIRHARRRGEQIVMVGTMSKDETVPDFTLDHAPRVLDDSKIASFQEVKDFPTSMDPVSQVFLIIPTTDPETTKAVFDEDFKARTKLINIRHLQDMIRTRVNPNTIPVDSSILDSTSWELDSKTALSSLESNYLSFGRVHAIVTCAMGRAQPNETFSLQHIQQAFQVVEESEKAGQTLQEKMTEPADASGPLGKSKSPSALAPKCNKYEKKLLNGVVKPDSIRTTFSDVHVLPETVEALNSLTSLSLIRPEAFSYGVLATDRIPGILLYGPPGTGKTLLAKAVARESGATVLEVSGSDIYDMYVGEGEKNVRAIFSLAKKLSPCVVFIDEADAMLGSRNQSRHRSSHRELINQFLREWDGMNDMSAFLMVATNRPFDLDDAVLRRLPRRLLVDLPTEQDREAILRIHLKDEQLDQSVNLSELAHRTPFYSGSDLKNVCVAAALACVREEHAQFTQQQQKSGESPHEFPRRILTKAHFERGIEEISASISEDMSSLNAIRKFDEKYGDRKGRRKRSAAWGFTPPSAAAEAETGETARVRA